MTKVIWKDPPPKRTREGRPSSYDEVIEQLRANAGRWGLIGTGYAGRSAGSRVRKLYPDIEVRSVLVDETGKYDVYGRAS